MEKFCQNVIRVISIIIIGFLTLVNITYFVSLNNYETSSFYRLPFIVLLCFIILLVIAFFVIRWIYMYFNNVSSKNKKKMFIFCLIIYAIASFYILDTFRYTPYSDQLSVVRLATRFVNEGLDGIRGNYYLYKYPHQVYMMSAFSMLFKIFRISSYRVIQYLNVVANCFTFIGLRTLLKKIDMKHRGLLIVFYITFVPLMLLLPFAYGDYIGLCLSVWTIYFTFKYMDKKKIIYALLLIIFLIFSVLFKTNNEIIIIAVGIALILNSFKYKLKECIKYLVFSILIVLCVVVPLKVYKNYFVDKLDLEEQKSIPTVAFVYMGMSESSRANGWYDTAVISDAWNDKIDKKQVYTTNIKERLKYFKNNPGYASLFYFKKMISGFCDPTYASLFYIYVLKAPLDTVYSNTEVRFLCYYLKISNVLIYVGALYVLLFDFKKNVDKKTLIYLIFIGGFMFHFLWEMKSRYVLPYYVILMPMGTLGLSLMMERFDVKKLKNKLKLK